jgi:hypothetical protein
MGKRSKWAKPNVIREQFVAYPVELLQSHAWRALSAMAKRCVERVAIELGKHGGKDNGQLPVTNRDFVAHGVPMAAIKPAIAEAVALGLIEHTPGYPCKNPDYGRAARFRILFLNSKGPLPDHTHWRRFKTHDEAKLAAKAAKTSAMRKRKAKARSYASPDASRSEALASASTGEALWGSRKVKHCVESESEALSTVSTKDAALERADASGARPATQASHRAKPERGGMPAVAVQPDADEAEPSPWSDQPPEPTP